MGVKKVLVVDDHPIVFEGLKSILGASFELLHVAASEQLLWEAVQRVGPELVVLDMAEPKFPYIQVIQRLSVEGSLIKTIVLAASINRTTATKAIQMGARAVVSKSSSIEEINLAFDEVLAGRTYTATELREEPSASFPATHDMSHVERCLTPRQREILQLFGAGYSAKEVGLQLFISKRTAENHKAKIKRLMGLQSNADLVRLALRLGSAHPPE